MPESNDTVQETAAALAKALAVISADKEVLVGERIVRMEEAVKRLQEDVSGLKRTVYENHDPVVVWCRNFIDSYRKIVTAVVVSGLVTFVGFLIQAYMLIQNRK